MLTPDQLMVLNTSTWTRDFSVLPQWFEHRDLLSTMLASGLLEEDEAIGDHTVWRTCEDGYPVTLKASNDGLVALAQYRSRT